MKLWRIWRQFLKVLCRCQWSTEREFRRGTWFKGPWPSIYQQPKGRMQDWHAASSAGQRMSPGGHWRNLPRPHSKLERTVGAVWKGGKEQHTKITRTNTKWPHCELKKAKNKHKWLILISEFVRNHVIFATKHLHPQSKHTRVVFALFDFKSNLTDWSKNSQDCVWTKRGHSEHNWLKVNFSGYRVTIMVTEWPVKTGSAMTRVQR